MKKIPTIFVRDLSRQPALVIPEWQPDCLWVRDGEGYATRKYDGTSCLIRGGRLFKRRELRRGDVAPPDFEVADHDPTTGKTVGWVPVGDGPDDKYHREGFRADLPDGTYELIGPKVQGNKEHRDQHELLAHALAEQVDAPRDFDGLRNALAGTHIEGIVWHHPDGRMAKIKRRDFGLKW